MYNNCSIQGVGETVFMLLSNVLDIKGGGCAWEESPPPMVGTFWKFWYKTLVSPCIKILKFT